MDKKMRARVSAPLRKAIGIEKKALKANEKLADFDEKVRDPQIKKLKKMEKRGK